MKLYTYFRAQEIAYDRLRAKVRELPYYTYYYGKEWQKLFRQRQSIRDGLIRRMERIELQLAQEKAKALELAEKKDYLD